MERISRAEIESSVDSFPDLDYKFEHIDWADIMDAEEASNPEMKLDVLQEKSYTIREGLFRSTVTHVGLPSLNSLKLDDHSRGLPPLDTKQLTGVNGSVPMLVSFSGVLNKQKVENNNNNNKTNTNQCLANKTPEWRKKELFKIPALPFQTGKRSLEYSAQPHTERKAVRLPPSPSSLHDNKRLKISEHCYNKDWKYGDDDFIFTSDLDWRNNRVESFRLPIPHSASVSTLESDTEVETSSAYSDTSSTSTLLSKRSYNRREELPLITDPHKLEQRQKQLDYGKNTDGYRNYLKLWPKINRKLSMPVTPEKSIGYSHRRWLGIMTKWRKALHQWDTMDNPPSNPKSQEFFGHHEDANTFPTLSLVQEATPETPQSAPETGTHTSYSHVLQSLSEDIRQPLQQEQQQQQQAAEQSSIRIPITPVANEPTHVTAELVTHINTLTYSSVLKAPVSASRTSHTGEDKLISTAGSNAAVSVAREAISSPPPDPSPLTALPSVNNNASQITPSADSVIIHNSRLDDSMDIDKPSHLPKETPNYTFNAQPLSYSQALKSKAFVNPTTMDTNTAEIVNETSNSSKELEKSSTEIISNENPKSYSQVLASTMLNGPNQETLISNKTKACSPETTGYKKS